METKTTTIDQYLKTVDADKRRVLEDIRSSIRALVPDAVECINYGVPTFKLNGKNLIHFAAAKNHCSLFPGPGAIAAFSEELTAFATSKGTIRFTVESPLPKSLVKKIVKHLVEKTSSRA
ncbi:MAG: DUF1801 domain-containing protein [Ignavibacteria bacterium]|nr:DUF1801 domain-containing protein [Ignavibacteria bacterium]MBK9184242.1 DUF1801 domain-containing protein [Ignavibacteria bacterium]